MITITNLASGINTTSGTHSSTATPAVGDLIIFCVFNTGNTASVAPSDNNADGLGTYTKILTAYKGNGSDTMDIWVRNALIGSATSTTFTQAAGTSTGGGISVIKVTGMSVAGLAAIRQFAWQDNQASGGTPTPVFSQVPSSLNGIYGVVFNGTNPATMTPRTGYTELVDGGYATPATGVENMRLVSGETSASIAWGSTSASAFCSAAIELAVDTSPTVVINSPSDGNNSQSATPALNFTGTDADSQDITYRTQVDTVSTFDSSPPTSGPIPDSSAVVSVNGANTMTVPLSTSGPNRLIIVTTHTSNNVDAVPSSPNLTFVKIGTSFTYATNGQQQVYRAFATQQLANEVITITSTSFPQMSAVIASFSNTDLSGTNGSGAIGATNNVTSGGATSSSASVTTTRNNSLVIGCFGLTNNFNMSPGTGQTEMAEASGLTFSRSEIEYQNSVTPASGTSVTNSVSWSTSTAGGGKVIEILGANTPLLDKISGVDSGYSGSPDNTDPFTSAQAVTYTVQAGDALTPGTTYYWRVAGKDPSGTNSYGAWATIRSFTVSTVRKPRMGFVNHQNPGIV